MIEEQQFQFIPDSRQLPQVKAPRLVMPPAAPGAQSPLVPGTMESFYSRLAALSALYSHGYNYLSPFLRYQQVRQIPSAWGK